MVMEEELYSTIKILKFTDSPSFFIIRLVFNNIFRSIFHKRPKNRTADERGDGSGNSIFFYFML